MIPYTKRLFGISIVISVSLLLKVQVGQLIAQPLTSADAVFTTKTFPLFSVIDRNPRVVSIIKKDKVFKSLSAKKFQSWSHTPCNNVQCYARQLIWTDEEIITAGNELTRLYQNKKRVRKLVAELRQQKYYPVYETAPDTALLRKAWVDAALGMNHIFDVYIQGKKPVYAKIDSISFKPGDTVFRSQVRAMMQQGAANVNTRVFYDFMLRSALQVLKINGRQEAVNYEPLRGGQNSQPFLEIKETNFSKYQYSVILVPGLGPEIPGQALDPGAAKRCEEGVARFKKGLAPFIVVSGGNVHPFRTPFNEAVEMKKYIVEKLGVPADVVFIEPHARHTTTNIRNTSRMIYRFHIPVDKPVLIVTDSSQANYIAGRMSATALRDLGYLPYRELKLLNNNEVEFYPVELSLQPDSLDPLDP